MVRSASVVAYSWMQFWRELLFDVDPEAREWLSGGPVVVRLEALASLLGLHVVTVLNFYSLRCFFLSYVCIFSFAALWAYTHRTLRFLLFSGFQVIRAYWCGKTAFDESVGWLTMRDFSVIRVPLVLQCGFRHGRCRCGLFWNKHWIIVSHAGKASVRLALRW